MKNNLRLKNFPISFFAPVLGFAGFTLSLQKAESLFNLSNKVTLFFLFLSVVLFFVVFIFYSLKFLIFKNEVAKEYHHPIKINFFPLISKTLLVFSIIFLSINMPISKWFWVFGVIINTFFTLSILGEWVSKDHFKIHHISPAWFIPVVGNLIIPIAGIQHFTSEISWFFFSAGIVWMFILTTIIFYRLIFHEPLVKKLVPTLFILFAAPSIAFIAYYKLTNSFDGLAHILYYFSLFLFVLIISQWQLFLKIRFYLSWWAYTFPLAALFLATALMHHITTMYLFKICAGFIILVLIAFVCFLAWFTFNGINKKTICVEED